MPLIGSGPNAPYKNYFQDSGSGPEVATPTATPSPQSTAAPPGAMDSSGAGYASPGLNNREWSIRDKPWYSAQQDEPSATAGVSGGVNNPSYNPAGPYDDRNLPTTVYQAPDTPMIASRGGRSPGPISDPNEDWIGGPDSPVTMDPSGAGYASPNLRPRPDPVNASDGPQVDVNWKGTGGAPYWDQPPTPRYNPGGNDVGQFGGNMSLGQFLSTPMAMLRFGGDHYQTPVGSGTVTYADTSSTTPGESDPPSFSDAEAAGAQETAALKASGQLNPDGTTPTGTAVSPPVRAALPAGPMDQAQRFSQNNVTGNWMADQTTNAYLLGGGDPGRANNPVGVSDEGHTIFSQGQWMLDPTTDPISGSVIRTPNLYNRATSGKAPVSKKK